jgi:hypothetical protein
MQMIPSYIWRSGLIATVLTVIGWSASHFGQIQSGFGAICALIGAVLLFPGGLVAAGIAMIFSPQGAHGIGQYSWVMTPGSWLAYFLAFTAWNAPTSSK